MTEAVEKTTEEKMVTLTIDGVELTVPEGTLVVDAAKMIGNDIPVFCYHPKMEPVGMCRMCLVDIGLPMRDRATGDLVLESDGSPKIQFGRTLQTGCTIRVAEGMVVVGDTEPVEKAREDVVEFLLTSHPLDCPICDKGGECPLQNLTMSHGAGESRFIIDDKIKLDKHVPLGELIYLDRERCIQCARCTRFQDEIVGDPVIGFNQRGRSLEIVTMSEPGFDSYWSGNTSDICPVGALTTADFRFGARPWELQSSASICNQCAVGCNLTFNTRREAKTGGAKVIKRAMPRQNESVNEIWMCDKGRFAGYQYTEGDNRLTQPLVRKGDKLVPTSWDDALDLVAEKIGKAGKNLVSLAGGRLSNEDYYNINKLTDHVGGQALLDSNMAGGDLVAQAGLGQGTNLSDLGKGDAILVIASDLEEEAPLWWLRVKQAAERGASLIIANPRSTKIDKYADYFVACDYGEAAVVALAILAAVSPKQPQMPAVSKKLAKNKELKQAADVFCNAENSVVFFGNEGMGMASSEILAQACANLVIGSGHTGRPNNGMVAVWDKGNAQGAWDMGLRPSKTLAADLASAKVTYIVGADPASDSKQLADAVKKGGFVVVQEINMTATAELADVVLPVQAFTERDGTYTTGERRVQRFYPAVPAAAGLMPDFGVTGKIAERLDLELEKNFAVMAFDQIAENVSDYGDLDYGKLSETTEQWPIIGRDDVYYGGTSYNNSQGLGVQLSTAADRGESVPLTFFKLNTPKKENNLRAVPITYLYDLGTTVTPSEVLHPRLAHPFVVLNPEDAKKHKLTQGGAASVTLNGKTASVAVKIDTSLSKGNVLVPRSMGLPISGPTSITVKAK